MGDEASAKMAAQVPATALEETTLDEPVSETLNRELRAIANKMHKVVVYSSDSKAELRNWDLWGPLVLCLVLAITLSTGATHAPVVDSKGHEIQAPTDDDSGGVFAAVFVIVWCGRCRHTQRRAPRRHSLLFPKHLRPGLLRVSPHMRSAGVYGGGVERLLRPCVLSSALQPPAWVWS